MTFEDIPQAIKEAMEERVQSALPGVGVYTDIEDQDFVRPGVLLYIPGGKVLDIIGNRVTMQYSVRADLLVELGTDLRSHYKDLDRMGSRLLGAFCSDYMRVGGIPFVQTRPSIDWQTKEAAVVTFDLTVELELADESGADSAPLMEELHTNVQ